MTPRPLPDPVPAMALVAALMVCSVAACAVVGGLVAARIFDRLTKENPCHPS